MTNTLQIGTVTQIQPDPDNNFRVLVNIPTLSEKPVWARLANMYATAGAGSFFYPEIDDEVIVGFFNNDDTAPVILGSLYNNRKQPAYTPDERNNTKAIVTKSQIKIVMDDDKKSVTISTPGNNKVILNDDTKSISLTDQNGNLIEMSPSGITIQSASNIVLKANQNINLSSTQGTNIKATG